jgi:ATP-dependent DNA helicase UvrD/PcrA
MSERTHQRASPIRTGKTADKLLADLNDAQRQAVTTTEGPVLIIAGAGSGKTKTLTHRIAYLMAARATAPERILAVTFTNKAAREMRERVSSLIGRRTGFPVMGTFHSLCARILRAEGHRIGLPPSFTIYDEDEARSVMKSVIVDAGLSPKTVPPDSILSRIGSWKDALRTPADIAAAADDSWEERAADLWARYEARLRELSAVDFDGLLSSTVALLGGHEEVRQSLEERFSYLSVDEYQDTNRIQAELLRLLTGTTKNLCVVGDDAQAIYGWRGARIENIREFPRQFPGCTVITLEENYRSTQPILATANRILAGSAEMFEKTLWTRREGGALPHRLIAHDERDEGRRILRAIERVRREGSYRWADAAILYRTNAQSRALEEGCLSLGIRYEIVGGLTFYERKEVKDVIAYLRLLQNPRDELAFRRIANVPTRGVGERTMERCLSRARELGVTPLETSAWTDIDPTRRVGLETLAGIFERLRAQAATLPPAILVERLLDETQFRRHLRDESERLTGRPDPGETRYENVLELRTVAARHTDLAEFLSELALMADVEKTSARGDADRLKLMTIHAAKGLEFPIVAVAGLEEGLLPHLNSMETTRELEEERRLCYVAVTRAKDMLLLSIARTRTIYGRTIETTPSRFLEDLGEHTGESDERHAAESVETVFDEPSVAASDEEQPFLRGERVRHAVFGDGTVEETDGRLLTVRFGRTRKRLDATLAPLEKMEDIHDI